MNKYEISYIQKDGQKVDGQIFTTENVSNHLKNLEDWGCHHIIVKSIEEVEESLNEAEKEELEAGDCGYNPEKDEYYYLKATNNPNKFEVYTYNYGKFNKVFSSLDKGSPFYNKLKLHRKNAVPHFKSLKEKVEHIEMPHEVYTKPEDLIRVNDELNQKALDGKLIGIRKEKNMLQFAEPQINGIWTMYLNDKGYIEKIVLF